MTGGDDWRNMLEVFRHDSMYVLHALVFSIYIAFATLVMLNLVTGVFVEGAQRIIREDKENECMKHAVKMFVLADVNADSQLTEQEFADLLETRAMADYCKNL